MIVRPYMVALGVLLLAPSPLLAAAEDDSSFKLAVWQGAEVQHLLTPSLAKALKLAPTDQFEAIDGEQVILLTREGNLFDLTQRQPLPAKDSLKLRQFSYSAGLLVAIREDRLGWYEDGKIQERIRLPSPRMHVVAGARQRLYLYGPQGDGSTVYLLDEGRVLRLLEIPKGKISSLTAIGERLFFAIGSVIYTAAKGEHAGLLLVAHGEKEIRSLAADPAAGLLYFSAGETVYAMRAGVAISILRGLAGYLRYSNNALFVLDPGKKRMVKVLGLEGLTIPDAPTPPQSPPPAFKE